MEYYYCSVCIALVIGGIYIIWRHLFRDTLRHLPGPRAVPLFGNSLQIDKMRVRLTLQRWAKEYGGVYRIRWPLGDTLVVSDYENLHKILVERGNDFAGRIPGFRFEFIEYSGSVVLMEPNKVWRKIRKVSHRYMKQFGDGMSRLEQILLQNADYMLSKFSSDLGKPVDTWGILRTATLQSISVLLLGRMLEPEDPLLQLLLQYERDLFRLTEMTFGTLLLDNFPFLIHAPLQASLDLKNFRRLQDECWCRIKQMQSKSEVESLTQMLLDLAAEESDPEARTRGSLHTETYAKMTSLALILAGVSTTPRVMYGLVNTMAFRMDIQEKVYTEISHVLSQEGISRITVAQRSRMPYMRATILECLRVFTPAPIGAIFHTALADQELPGYGVIPKGTIVVINLWTLHHDETFWHDPDVFRPERFLDEDGQLLPPDHPNRKHLMPFGAGPRVCLGEVFAMTRLFLWTAAIVNKFEITPSPMSDKSWMDPNVHLDATALHLLPNKVVFKARE